MRWVPDAVPLRAGSDQTGSEVSKAAVGAWRFYFLAFLIDMGCSRCALISEWHRLAEEK